MHFWTFEILSFRLSEMFEDESRRRGLGNYEDPRNSFSQIVNMNSVSMKNMKRKFGESCKLFYFQVRESPAPLNMPIPTCASDRGGAVACIGSPVALATDPKRS